MKKIFYFIVLVFAAFLQECFFRSGGICFAIVQNPIIGRAKNSFGNAIFSTVYGKNIIRSKAIEVRRNDSALRLLQRSWFKDAHEVTSAAIFSMRLGSSFTSTERSPYASSMALKMSIPAVMNGTANVVDIANMQISDGNIPAPSLASNVRTSQFVVDLTVTKPLRPDLVAYTGTFYAVCLQRIGVNVTGVYAAETSVAMGAGATTAITINLGSEFSAAAVDTYVFFVATNGGTKKDSLSDSVYASVV